MQRGVTIFRRLLLSWFCIPLPTCPPNIFSSKFQHVGRNSIILINSINNAKNNIFLLKKQINKWNVGSEHRGHWWANLSIFCRDGSYGFWWKIQNPQLEFFEYSSRSLPSDRHFFPRILFCSFIPLIVLRIPERLLWETSPRLSISFRGRRIQGC